MRIAIFAAAVAALGLAAGAAYWSMPHAPRTIADEAALATPPGITLVDVTVGATLASTGFMTPITKPAFADPNGMVLYTFDQDQPGQTTCAADCAKSWPAVTAPAQAKSFGDWSVIAQADGTEQWAYKGRPLYRFVKDDKYGQAKGNGADGAWHVALYRADEGIALPDGAAVRDLPNSGGDVYVDAAGRPFYTSDADEGGKPACLADPCVSHWAPFAAAALATPIGDFTIVDRDDGVRQWAYKGRPLYSFDGDVAAGDAPGDGLDGKWHVARRMRQFMPADVAIRRNRFGGSNLATAAGMTLYVRDRVFGPTTGHSMRDGITGIPTVGRTLGTASCNGDCTSTWHPLAAPADAIASGYWGVATRADGSKQWVYRGFAVYTFAGDHRPGDMLGNDTYEIMYDHDPFTAADERVKGMGAMEWHTAVP